MEPLATLEMIRREMKRKHITPSALSRGMKMNHSSLVGMLNRPTMQVQRLAELSEALNYNFFREIASQFSCTEPEINQDSCKLEVAGLKSRIRDLELEVSILRQTIKDLAGR